MAESDISMGPSIKERMKMLKLELEDLEIMRRKKKAEEDADDDKERSLTNSDGLLIETNSRELSERLDKEEAGCKDKLRRENSKKVMQQILGIQVMAEIKRRKQNSIGEGSVQEQELNEADMTEGNSNVTESILSCEKTVAADTCTNDEAFSESENAALVEDQKKVQEGIVEAREARNISETVDDADGEATKDSFQPEKNQDCVEETSESQVDTTGTNDLNAVSSGNQDDADIEEESIATGEVPVVTEKSEIDESQQVTVNEDEVDTGERNNNIEKKPTENEGDEEGSQKIRSDYV